MKFKYRKATFDDIDELDLLIILSARSINSSYYTEFEINAALGTAWTVDKQLIIDDTYWVVETVDGKIVAAEGGVNEICYLENLSH